MDGPEKLGSRREAAKAAAERTGGQEWSETRFDVPVGSLLLRENAEIGKRSATNQQIGWWTK